MRRASSPSAALVLASLLAVAACANPRVEAEAAAHQAGLVRSDVEAPPFRLAVWRRPVPGAATLHVYLEGDGHAWINRSMQSGDPTPRTPVALRLAAAERRGAVLYVARPCQFVMNAACAPRYWGAARFAPEVVDAVAALVRREMEALGTARVRLVGYSGGGVLAALVAVRLDGVSGLFTVASPLDLAGWAAHHRVSPLSQSLTPMDDLDRLRSIPQIHFSGGNDDVVPPAIGASFLRRLGGGCARQRVIDDFDHQCCWATRPMIVQEEEGGLLPGDCGQGPSAPGWRQ